MDYVAPLATITLKAAAIVAAAWITNRALQRGSAAARHLVWNAAFAALAIAAIAELYTPHHELGSVATAENALTQSAVRNVPSAPDAPQSSWPLWIFLAWIAGAALTASRLLFSLAMASSIAVRPALVSGWYDRAQRLRRRLAIRRDVELLVTHDSAMPMTWGALNPVVILPASAATWTDRQVDMVLAHELAHIKRWDWLTQLLAYACCAAYWFFPPVWFALRQSRKEREQACDDTVLRLGARPTDYADHLVQLARSMSRLSWSTAVAMAQESHLEHRVTAMLDTRTSRAAAPRIAMLGVGAALVACLIPLARWTLAPPQLEGTVFDASGAVVPGAAVALISDHQRYTTRTGPDGAFALRGIPSGVYELQAMHPGFRRFRRAPVFLGGGQRYHIRPVLTVGAISERLVVLGKL